MKLLHIHVDVHEGQSCAIIGRHDLGKSAFNARWTHNTQSQPLYYMSIYVFVMSHTEYLIYFMHKVDLLRARHDRRPSVARLRVQRQP